MLDDGDYDVDFEALAALEEQALAARGVNVTSSAGAAAAPAEKSKSAKLVVDASAAPFAAPSRPPGAIFDLTADSPRENRVPACVPEAKQAEKRETRDGTVAESTTTTEATTTAAAAPRPPPQPQPPPPARYLTLADVAKPPELVDLPWLNKEIKLDRSAARTWLAPVRPPPRPYQATIAATALLHNTLVCLPTGLGKTMVASIVMRNFARWFPAPAKVVFVAPTRPLVSQQVDACARAMGVGVFRGGDVDGSETAVELTGSSATPAERAAVWDRPDVRYVFTTPQAFRNDLSLGLAPAHRVVCVVVDECHRCVGRSDAAVALSTLTERHGVSCRVVGLSATPGSTRGAVQEVLSNTKAARIEFRSEGDPCLREYVHERSTERLVVPPPPPAGPARAAACRALRRSLASARSCAAAAIAAGNGSSGSGGNGKRVQLSGGTLSLLSTTSLPTDPETAPRATLASAAKKAERAAKEARIALSGSDASFSSDGACFPVVDRALEAARHLRASALLAGARDAIDAYGVRGGADYLSAREADAAEAGLCRGRGGADGDGAGRSPPSSSLCEPASEEYRSLLSLTVGSGGDPKLAALLGVLERHFAGEDRGTAGAARGKRKNKGADERERERQRQREDRTRAIVFASLRETVAVVVRALKEAGYDARPFVGQGNAAALASKGSASDASGGMRQAEQAATLAAFRSGEFPVLVATCVGEEGLDVPAVDLCVCYDAAASPLRGVQRAGRAGRARPGAVVSLLSSGREEASAAAAEAAKAELHAALRRQAFELARRAPRMLPREFVPTRVDVDLRAGIEEGDDDGRDEDGGCAPAGAGAAASRRNVVSSSRRAVAAGGRGKWGSAPSAAARKDAAPSSAPAPPSPPSQQRHPRLRPGSSSAAASDALGGGLLFPEDTAPVVRLSPAAPPPPPRPPPREEQSVGRRLRLVVDPPPAALVAAVEAERERGEAKGEAETPSAGESGGLVAVAARLTQVLSVSQKKEAGSASPSPSPWANQVDPGRGERDDGGGEGTGEGDEEDFGGGWLDAGGWGDDVDFGGEAGVWDPQQSLSSAGAGSQGGGRGASAGGGAPSGGGDAPPSSAAAAAVAGGPSRRVLLDSASPAALAVSRRALPRSSDGDEDDSPGAGLMPRRRLLKKRRTSRAGREAAAAAAAQQQQQRQQQQQQRRRPANAASAFFDAEAGLSSGEEGGEEEDESEDDGSYESSFLDDGTQPEEEESGEEEQGRRRRGRPRRLSDELAAYRSRMVQEATEDGRTPRGRGRRGQRRRLDDDLDDGEEEGDNNGAETDDYDEDDSFIATARSDGRAPSVAGPSQHDASCAACGGLGGVGGRGPLLCCATCPTAVHAGCLRKGSGEARGRDWRCAVCCDD